MKTWLLNFLMTRIGAALAPVILGALASLVAVVAKDVPWLAPHVTMESCLAFVGIVLAVAMSFINYLTTARGFKYAGPVQRFISVLGEKMGLPPLKLDQVIATKTAERAELLEFIVSEKAAEDNRDGREAARAFVRDKIRPVNGRGGLQKGHALVWLMGVLAVVSLGMAVACSHRIQSQGALGAGEGHNLSRAGSTPAPATTSWSERESESERGETAFQSWAAAQRVAKIQEIETRRADYWLPWEVRLLRSLRLHTEVGSSHARLKVERTGLEMSGTWLENEQVRFAHLMPQSYALGAKAELHFFSFTEP